MASRLHPGLLKKTKEAKERRERKNGRVRSKGKRGLLASNTSLPGLVRTSKPKSSRGAKFKLEEYQLQMHNTVGRDLESTGTRHARPKRTLRSRRRPDKSKPRPPKDMPGTSPAGALTSKMFLAFKEAERAAQEWMPATLSSAAPTTPDCVRAPEGGSREGKATSSVTGCARASRVVEEAGDSDASTEMESTEDEETGWTSRIQTTGLGFKVKGFEGAKLRELSEGRKLDVPRFNQYCFGAGSEDETELESTEEEIEWHHEVGDVDGENLGGNGKEKICENHIRIVDTAVREAQYLELVP
ncbi:hypothetical protein AAMO2058_000137500 [Amorphochlora amoebiformis]